MSLETIIGFVVGIIVGTFIYLFFPEPLLDKIDVMFNVWWSKKKIKSTRDSKQ